MCFYCIVEHEGNVTHDGSVLMPTLSSTWCNIKVLHHCKDDKRDSYTSMSLLKLANLAD